MMQTLVDRLSEIGYNYDKEIDEEDFQEALKSMHENDLSLAFLERKNEPSFRDDRPRKSLHLKDSPDWKEMRNTLRSWNASIQSSTLFCMF